MDSETGSVARVVIFKLASVGRRGTVTPPEVEVRPTRGWTGVKSAEAAGGRAKGMGPGEEDDNSWNQLVEGRDGAGEKIWGWGRRGEVSEESVLGLFFFFLMIRRINSM